MTCRVEAVSSRPGAGAYRVALVEGRAVESRLDIRYLVGGRHRDSLVSGPSWGIIRGSGGDV